MAQKAPESVRFGAFELNVRTGELLSLEPSIDGAPPQRVLLREQPFQILRILIDGQGQVISREEIRKRLWPNDTIVDFDRSINVAMTLLRRALGDSAESPRYIETLARRGYRLLVPTEWQQGAVQSAGAEDSAGLPASETFTSAQAGGLIGKKVSRYRVLEVLGAGGMGMVYKAEDLKLGRRVALKFLPEELAEDPAALHRFEREAQTASALNHPNICTIFGIEEYEAKPFIVMELLEGDTLSQRLVKLHTRPFSLDVLLEVGLQICDGLQAAHGKGIIHRDIKPGNIFLTNDGPVKILDFGLAKLAAVEEELEKSPEDGAADLRGTQAPPQGEKGPRDRWDLTVTGIALGTMGYMSPEQIRKEKLDARTDLFSFGLVLYEMATGSRAFAGGTAAIAHEAILNQKPAPASDLNPSLPRRLDAIISKAIEKDRTKRYQSAAEMREDLLKVRHEIRPARIVRRWAIAAVLVVAIAAAGWFYLRNRVALSATDTIVRADFDNQTGDAAFTDGLKQALEIALDQTPYLNILSRDKVRETLVSLNLPGDAKLTADIARRVCLRTGSRLVVTGSIADEGNRFHIELGAIDCGTGRTLARVANDADSRDEIVHVLGATAVQLRAKLGEPKSSLAEFNKPLETATSSSPEALHFLALAYQSHLANDLRTALGYYGRAIEKDPNLALAYAGAGSASSWVGDADSGKRDRQKAFELRDRLTAPNEFQVETMYYDAAGGTAQLDKFLPIAERWVRTFPHDVIARINFSVALHGLGRHEDALVQAREAARLLPSGQTYQRLFEYAIAAERLDEAAEIYDQIISQKFDTPTTHFFHALLAFLRGDQQGMQQDWTWAAQHPGADGDVPYLQEELAAYHGRFRESNRLRDQLIGIAVKEHRPIGVGALNASRGLVEAELGDVVQSRRSVTEALKASKHENTLVYAALASARTGDIAQVQAIADYLNQQSPQDFLMQNFSLPTIRAAIKLNQNDPAAAVRVLQPVTPYDLAFFDIGFDNAYPAYLRGLSYLQLKDGRLAALEFQKVLDHEGVVQGAIIGALARLQLARAQVMMGDQAAARKSYEDFLTLWKDADADVPLFKEVKAEYARIAK
jgi:DNA-binding winged helix-turn-helix (wHTH) protein/tetratricopeptide (TPR) repeat protein/tRNA A-37 threonylcarbamoyl transferase component Bud32